LIELVYIFKNNGP